MKKTCSTCGKVKPIEDFNKKAKARDGRQNYCRACNSDKVRRHYEANKDRRIREITERKQDIYRWFQEYRSSQRCKYCPEREPCCLEFHHRDPNEKDFEIATAANWGLSIQSILEEIAKCDVVCSNCHNKIHAGVLIAGDSVLVLKPVFETG